jgi:Trypsin-co-occurring domain 1
VATKLIQLEDGLLIEAEVPGDQAEPISGGAVDKVDAALDVIEPLLVKACKPITAAWKQLSDEANIDQAQVALGVNFTGEGNVYIAKATAGANLTITLVFKPNLAEKS